MKTMNRTYLSEVVRVRGVKKVSYFRNIRKSDKKVIYTFNKKYAKRFDNVDEAKEFNRKFKLKLFIS